MGRTGDKAHPEAPTAVLTRVRPPMWAIRRVETLVGGEGQGVRKAIGAEELARRAGMSKSLARRCMEHLARATD